MDSSESDDSFLSKQEYLELKYNNKKQNPIIRPLTRQLSSRTSILNERGRRTVLKSSNDEKLLLSDSDEDDEKDNFNKKNTIEHVPGEYDAKLYENLDVNEEIKEIFQYISKYTPQNLTLETRFKPFIPEFIPAVGDIDAFLKVIPPELSPSGKSLDYLDKRLGLEVLDEPATNQSDPALLHLQMRAASITSTDKNNDYVVKTVENIEKNGKIIDKWIKDISDLHKTKSSATVRYSEPMPDIDELMQEWPEEIEKQIKENGLPKPKPTTTITEYVDEICLLFKIPKQKNKIHSLHLLFTLYASIKNSQLFTNTSSNNEINTKLISVNNNVNQLVLDE